MNCVICSNPIGIEPSGWDGGHNPEPVAEGRCCEPCNNEIVLPARLVLHGFSQEQIDRLPPWLWDRPERAES